MSSETWRDGMQRWGSIIDISQKHKIRSVPMTSPEKELFIVISVKPGSYMTLIKVDGSFLNLCRFCPLTSSDISSNVYIVTFIIWVALIFWKAISMYVQPFCSSQHVVKCRVWNYMKHTCSYPLDNLLSTLTFQVILFCHGKHTNYKLLIRAFIRWIASIDFPVPEVAVHAITLSWSRP